MSVEIIGILTIILGCFCLLLGPRFSTYALMSTCLLGAAAAVTLPSFGGANLPPAQILLGFLLVDLLLRPRLFAESLKSSRPFQPGFWFLATLAYAIPITFIVPRLFAGAFYVFAIGRSEAGAAVILQTPMGPTSGNITQPIYLIGSFICYFVFYAYRSVPGAMQNFARATIFCSFMNILFAILDLATYTTGTDYLLSFIRNASYRMLTDVELAGFKRVVGSFSEAGSFALTSVTLFAFNITLWLRKIYSWASGIAAAGLFICVLLSTSSTGYGSITLFLAVQYVFLVMAIIRRVATTRMLVWAAMAPVLFVITGLAIYLHEPTRHMVVNLAEITIFTKLDSDSGVERASWNRQALVALWQTFGLGAGIGSVRASSWLVAVPVNLGLFGALTYWTFCISAFYERPEGTSVEVSIQVAARLASLALVLAASVTAGGPDLGLYFCAFAAMGTGTALATSRARTGSQQAAMPGPSTLPPKPAPL